MTVLTSVVMFLLALAALSLLTSMWVTMWGNHPEQFPRTLLLNRHNSRKVDSPENYALAEELVSHYLNRDIIGSDVFQIAVSETEVKFWIYDVDAVTRRVLRRDGEDIGFRVERFERTH